MRFQFISSSGLALLLCALTTAAQSGSVSLRPNAASSPGSSGVKVTVDQKRVPVGTQVTFTLTPASAVNDPLNTITLFFGDGEKQLMKEAQAVHTYYIPGNYIYSILVKRNDGRNDPTARVTLIAPPSIEVAQAGKFSAEISPPLTKAQYRFVFGDGESSAWQASPQASHEYRARGVYLARVEVSASGRAVVVSALRQVKVTPAPSVSVSLISTPSQPPAGEPVTLRANVSQPRPGTQYRFTFGDGQQSFWQVEPETQHVYKTPGQYSASVEVTQSDRNRNVSGRSAPAVIAVQKPASPGSRPTPQTKPSPSPSPQTSPTPYASPSPNGSPSPTGSPSPPPNDSGSPSVIGAASPTATDSPLADAPAKSSNLWKYLLVAALLLILVYKASGLLFAGQPTFAAVADPGVADLPDHKAGLPIDFQLVLKPNVSTGEYNIKTQGGSLVQNADRLSGREILEL